MTAREWVEKTLREQPEMVSKLAEVERLNGEPLGPFRSEALERLTWGDTPEEAFKNLGEYWS